MGESAEEIDGEARIGRQIVAPDDLPAAEDRVEPALIGGGEAATGQALERRLGYVIRRDRRQLGVFALPDVGRHCLG